MDEKQAMIASLINNLIRDEWEAIEGYNGVIATLADSEGDDIDGIISNLEDIRDEEYVHVGQLESCLSVLKGDPVEQIDDGSEEGFEKLELPEEEDEDDDEEESELGLEERLDKDTIKDMDIDEVKRRLKAVGFDGASFMGKSDKELRAMLKISRQARGNQALQKWKKDGKTFRNTPIEEEKSGLSEAEMKKVICSMINEYDASEEEVYDELSSATPDVSRDLVHRLYQMCSGNKEEPQQETSFEDFWNEMEETEED